MILCANKERFQSTHFVPNWFNSFYLEEPALWTPLDSQNDRVSCQPKAKQFVEMQWFSPIFYEIDSLSTNVWLKNNSVLIVDSFFVHLNTTNLWKHDAVLPRQKWVCLRTILYQFALLTFSISFTLITGPNMYVIIKVDAVKFISLKAISKEQSETEFSSINRSDTSQLEFSFFQSVQWRSQTVSELNYWCIYT